MTKPVSRNHHDFKDMFHVYKTELCLVFSTLKSVRWTLAELYFNRGLQTPYTKKRLTGFFIILQKTINRFLYLLIVFLKSKTHQLNLKDLIKLKLMVTDRDKIAASQYERKTMRSALIDTGSKTFNLVRQCLIQVVNRQ